MITEAEDQAPGAEDFLRATEHVPGEVKDDHANDFAGVNVTPPPAPGAVVQGWTVEQVAAIFDGVFTVLVCARMFVPVGGEHWNIPSEKTLLLGQRFLPIFQRHIPWSAESNANLIPMVIMWVGAIGALKQVCGTAIETEIRLYQLAKMEALRRARGMTASSTTANTGTGTSPASSSSQVNGNPVRPGFSGENSQFSQPIEE